jgi:LAO/AO transport system kinase
MLPGAGDELQGIKKGILELADMVAVNKADGDNRARATAAAADYGAALHLITPPSAKWQPPVVLCSAVTEEGLPAIWAQIERHRGVLAGDGAWDRRREDQQVRWMWSMVDERLLRAMRASVASLAPGLEADVRAGRVTAALAAERLLDAFGHGDTPGALQEARRTE